MSPIRKVCNKTEVIFDMSQMPMNKTVEQQKMKVVAAAAAAAAVVVVVAMVALR